MVVPVHVDAQAAAAGRPTLASDGLCAVLSDGRRVLLEFQGSVEGASSAGCVVGELEAGPPASGGEPTLVLGTQRLAGRVVRLAHPLAVLEVAGDAVRVSQLIAEKIVFDARPSTVFADGGSEAL